MAASDTEAERKAQCWKDGVPCYICRPPGQRMRTWTGCALPAWGCGLCRAHGDGYGSLQAEYKTKTAVVDGVVYSPPKLDCFQCADTKTGVYHVWDDRLRNDSWSNKGHHLMPKLVLPCSSCCKEEHEAARAKKKAAVLALPPGTYKDPDDGADSA